MNVDENNNVTKARYIETSQATPVVTVTSVSVTQVQPSTDAQYIIGTLNLAGAIASTVQDITPISANQNISEVLVYLNDSEDPIGTISAAFTKIESASSFLHPFPYAGSFAGSLQNVPLLEGVNVVRAVVRDPVDGMEGYAEYSFQVEAISPFAQTSASLDVQLTAPLSAASVDTVTATLIVSGVGSLVNQTLTETATDSRVFVAAGGSFQVTIRTGGETLDPAAVDEMYAVATASALGVTDLPFPLILETGNDTKLFHQSVSGGSLASLDVEVANPLSAASVDTISATLTVPGVGSVVAETLTETAADSRVFANAAQTFHITISNGAETLDPTSPDEIYALVTEDTLGVTGLAFSFMQETGNDTKTFHKDIYSSDEYVADYTGFSFALSQVSQVGASHGGVFKPYLLQVQGPDLFLQYLQEIELDDGPRQVEQSPIDGKYYVRMKNSPALAAQFRPQEPQPSEPDHDAILRAMLQASPDLAYRYGFTHGFLAGGIDMFEGIWSLTKFIGTAAYQYNNPRILWRMTHGDTFETEQRFVRKNAETAKKLAEIYAAVAQDDIVYLTALWNGTEPDPNDLSPYNIAMMDAAEVIIEMGKDLAREYANDPQKRGYYDGRAAFEIVSILLPYTKPGTAGKLSKLQFLNELRARPMFSSLTGKGAAAFERLATYLSRLETTRMCFVAGTPVYTEAGLKNIEEIVRGDTVLSCDEATGERSWKQVLDTITTHPSKLYEVHYRPHMASELPTALQSEDPQTTSNMLVATGEHPFFVANRSHPGFVPVGELVAGDQLLTADGGTAVVTEIAVQAAAARKHFTTYNLEVADFHTYYVGSEGVWVHNFSTRFCQNMFARLERLARQMGISNPTGRKFSILDEAFKTARFKSASEPNFAMHVTGVETIEEYAARYPTYGPSNPVEEVYSFAQQKRMIDRFGSGIWEKHHLAERRVSRALGMTEEVLQDTSPAINLPTRVGEGFKSMSAEELAMYRTKFGRDPVTHRGPNGIKEAIEEIFSRYGFPYEQTLTPTQQQTLINELHVLYAQDARFEHLKLWPATRDWLRRHFSGGSLQIPD